MITIDPSDYDLFLREISAGIWFFVATSMTLILISYAVRHLIRREYWTDPTPWTALAIGIYFCGSAIRVFTNWGSIIAIRKGWDITPWLTTNWYFASLVLSITGSLWAIWQLSPRPRRAVYTGLSLLISIIIPTAVHRWL